MMSIQNRGSEATICRREPFMTQRKPSSTDMSTPVRRYVFAVSSVTIALGLALLLTHFNFRGVADPLFLLAVAVAVWFFGTGPGILAVVLSSVVQAYFFIEPIYSFYITPSELPHFIIFILFATLLTWFSTVRRRIELDLLRSRDQLQKEVTIRTQQASLLELTHDTIFVRDMNDIITYWNRGASELFGWTESDALGKDAHQLLRTSFPEPIKEIQAKLLNTGRWEGEVEKTRSDDTRVIVASRWSLQRDDQKNPVAILETNNDITQRRRDEEQVRKLNQELGKRSTELEASNKELEAFAYSISHDLRAPLRHMSGFAELLQKNAASILDEKGRRYMTMILESSKRMGALIDDLLAFSRIGRTEARVTLVNLGELVREIQSEVLDDTEGRNITWRVGPLPDLHGDRSMLKLALMNLISNAVKFTRTRPQAEIEIGCTDTDKEKLGVVVFVRDNGVGFDMKYVHKLFGVFQRLHRAEEFEGTGIGLATVQRIIRRHGGEVWAEGVVDKGSTFYLSLPRS
jgi:PAS domain S-box-containing protein